MEDIIILVLGFVGLIWGAEKLVDGASSIAIKFKIPLIVIGLTIVAFGTSAPELVVNIFAAINGNSDIALGNIVGSNIFNIAGILGVSAIIYPITVKSNSTWIEIPLALLAAITVFVVSNDIFFDGVSSSFISRTDGIMLLLFFVIFMAYNFQLSKNPNSEILVETKVYTKLKSILFVILGLALLIVGGRTIVYSAVNIAEMLGLSQRLIALTVVSIGTSLPELATALVAAKKKKDDLVIGNIIGSNIFNTFFILGCSGVITPLKVLPASQMDLIYNIILSFAVLFFVFLGRGRKISRIEGLVLFFSYIVYLILVIMSK